MKCLCVFLLVCVALCYGSPQERRLYEQIFETYNPYVRPVDKPTDTLKVGIYMPVLGHTYLDKEKWTISTQSYWTLNWTDTALKWKPSEYKNLTNIHIPVKEIWSPDLFLGNTMIGDQEGERLLAICWYDGTVVWEIPAELETGCFADDEKQKEFSCNITAFLWTYHGWEVDLKLTDKRVHSKPDYTVDWGYKVQSVTPVREVTKIPGRSEPYPSIRYKVKFSKAKWSSSQED